MKCFEINVRGRVQGVGYRNFVYKTALRLDIQGFVKNMRDGSVFITAEGEKKNLESFVEFCKVGSSYSNVQTVDYQEVPIVKFKKFEIQI